MKQIAKQLIVLCVLTLSVGSLSGCSWNTVYVKQSTADKIKLKPKRPDLNNTVSDNILINTKVRVINDTHKNQYIKDLEAYIDFLLK